MAYEDTPSGQPLVVMTSIFDDVPKKPTLFNLEGKHQNWGKVEIALRIFNVDHDVVTLDGLQQMKTDWFKRIHPDQMIPAFIDKANGKRIVLWDSTSILIYLCEKYDKDGLWAGKDWAEKSEVFNWLMFHTATFQPAAKAWAHMDAERFPDAKANLKVKLQAKYELMEQRLNEPNQQYLAVADRPTVADIASCMFCDELTIKLIIGFEKGQWPNISRWSDKMQSIPEVKSMFEDLARGRWKPSKLDFDQVSSVCT